jgi:amidase
MKADVGLDAIALAALVAKGEVTALELVEQAIARAEEVNPKINAIIQPLYERARQEARAVEARGPLSGVPFVVKDLHTPSKGDPQHDGSAVLKGLDYRADHDGYLVQKCRAAGLVTIGRTNVPEFASGPDCEARAYGPTRNPWSTEHASLGSSGGSAAAVSAGIVPIAHGTDGGGSVRIPSSACGIVGLKPTRGRISNGPEMGESWAGFGTSGVHGRTARDVAAGLDAMAGPMPGDPYALDLPATSFLEQTGLPIDPLRVGVAAGSENPEVQADCARAAEDAARLLEGLGHHVEISQPAALRDEDFRGHYFRIVSSQVAENIAAWGERIGREFGEAEVEPVTWFWLQSGRSGTATEYVASLNWLHRFSRRVAQWWTDGFDVLVTSTLACPPPKLGLVNNLEHAARVIPDIIRFTAPFNVTGQPAITLPLHGTAEGLPIGVQLVAAYGREDLLLRLAAQVEEAQPWRHRVPPVFARS